MANKPDEYAAILAEARQAGDEASKSIPDTGAIGWAWVHVMDGNSSFARWLRREQGCPRDIVCGNYRGVRIDARYSGQAVSGSMAYADAMAEVLKAHGIQCYSMQRWD